MKNNIKNLKSIDLFAGIGGIRLGFEKAGFETVYANDFDKYCKYTYDLNFPETSMTLRSISNIKSKDLPNFNVLLAGFPCQPFSIAGHRKGFKDKKRGNLFFDITRIIKEKKPEVLFLENVKNLKGHDNGKTYRIIKETLEDLGYYIKSKVLNSMEYGNIPQNRERIYIVGFDSKIAFNKFAFPKKIKLILNVRNLLEKSVDKEYYYSGKPLFNKLKNEIVSKNTVYQWRRKYVRDNKKRVCPTLTANMGMGGHNVPIIMDDNGIRKLTPKECAKLQGFPDSYKLPNMSDSHLYKQIGNSVTVTVVERIAKNVAKALR